ncbi:MAG: VCBS repeat-containing protein [Phycisphaeraceae bacterium]|nr:MAG: VCBS repeat-containing protein [Phycisphaeraceae bacterium]
MFHTRLRGLVLLVLVSMVGLSARATDYFVSTAGKDTNSGTSVAAPFKTITKALSLAGAGDTIYIRPGTYQAAHVVSRSGAPGKPLRIVGDIAGEVFGTKGTVIIRNPPGTALTIKGMDHVEISNVRVARAKVGIEWTKSSGGKLVACDLANATSTNLVAAASEIEIRDSIVRGSKGVGISAETGTELRVVNTRIYGNHDDGIAAEAGSDVECWNCEVYSNRKDGIDTRGGKVVVVNSLLRNNTGAGLAASKGSDAELTVWHCTIARNKGDGVSADAGVTRIYNTILAHNTGFGFDLSGAKAETDFNLYFSNLAGNKRGLALAKNETTADPLFLSSSVYSLKAGSPAINKGQNPEPSVTDDLAGSVRPEGGRYDIGAYEGVASLLFTDVTSDVGFGVPASSDSLDGGGMTWLDVDGDGDLDCIITGSRAKLLINKGGKFVAQSIGIATRQAAIGDYDGDGLADLLSIGTPDTNSETLFLNQSGWMTEFGDAGIVDPKTNFAAVASDIDGDGRLDALILAGTSLWHAVRATGSTPAFTTAVGLTLRGETLGYVASADINNDGFLDLFNAGSGRVFLSSEAGAHKSIITLGTDATSRAPVGATWGDFDNDGDFDLYVAGSAKTVGRLYEADGLTFEEIAEEIGLDNPEEVAMRGCAWGDFDNDGDVDLYVCTASGGNLLFRNDAGTFVLVWIGAEAPGDNLDCAFVDFDNDGDLDIAITRANGSSVLLKNNLDDERGFHVRLVGAGPGATNTSAVGVVVELYDESGSRLIGKRTIGGARGLGGSDPHWAHFGGVEPKSNYLVRAHFRSGIIEAIAMPGDVSSEFGGVSVPRVLTITEPSPRGGSLRVVRWREIGTQE